MRQRLTRSRTPFRKTLVSASASLLLVAFSSSASAGSIGIKFDFSQSVISILGGVITVPPDGTVETSLTTVRIPGDGLATAASGPGFVRDIGMHVVIDADIQGQAHVTGTVDVLQSGIASGMVMLNGTAATLVLSAIQLSISPDLACTGAGCDFIGTFPIDQNVMTAVMGALRIANVNDVGNAAIQETLGLTLGGVSAVVQLIGVEVSRTLVPEPNTAMLLWLGLGSAVLLGRRAGVGAGCDGR